MSDLIRPADGWLAQERAIEEKIKQDGIPRCFVCGYTLVECAARAEELGFDECEWLAEK